MREPEGLVRAPEVLGQELLKSVTQRTDDFSATVHKRAEPT